MHTIFTRKKSDGSSEFLVGMAITSSQCPDGLKLGLTPAKGLSEAIILVNFLNGGPVSLVPNLAQYDDFLDSLSAAVKKEG